MSDLNLRDTVVSAAKWNVLGQSGRQIVSFLVSIILARLLLPSEFGLLAMLFVFQEVANAFINSGLNAPLIQRKEISDEDCSTVFFFNVTVGLLCYLLLVLSAPMIAGFYGEPSLEPLVSAYGLVFVVHSFGNVQVGLLMRNLNFRELNLIGLTGVMISGTVAVLMAIRGFGVYSLVGQHIVYALVTTGLFWWRSPWRPTTFFHLSSFRRLFGFGSRVLVVALLDKVLNAVDNVIVGKLRGTAFLGQFSRGKTTRDLPITQVNSVLTSLVFPVFSRLPNREELRKAQDRFLGVVSYITAPLMVGMLILAEPLLVTVYSEIWRPAAVFLRLFALFGITVPLNGVLVQTIMASGEDRSFFRLELGKKSLLFGSLGIGALLGPIGLLWSLCVGHYLALFLSIRVAGSVLQTSASQILRSFLPGVGLALLMAVPVYASRELLNASDPVELMVPTLVGLATYWGLSALFGSRDYLSARTLLMEHFSRT